MDASAGNENYPKNQNVCAVIITHNPVERFPILLDELGPQVAYTIVVDNASSKKSLEYINQARKNTNISIIENAENLGVSVGLNQGCVKAGQLGFDWVITFDQDSRPEAGMVDKLLKLLQMQTETSEIGIIAPKIIDVEANHSSLFLKKRNRFLYERVECDQAYLNNITTVITTGSLIRLSAFEILGGFREGFFIDYVDTEFCLRLQLHGYQIWVACDAELHHALGHRRAIKKGPFILFPTFHSPERWYTISRNRIQMIKSYGFYFPHWLLYELVATGYIVLRMLLTEDKKFAKLHALFKGTWDGIRGRLGKPYWAKA